MLYCEFLNRHETLPRQNARKAMQLKNLDRFSVEAREAMADQAKAHRLAQG